MTRQLVLFMNNIKSQMFEVRNFKSGSMCRTIDSSGIEYKFMSFDGVRIYAADAREIVSIYDFKSGKCRFPLSWVRHGPLVAEWGCCERHGRSAKQNFALRWN